MTRLFLIPQQGEIFLSLTRAGIALGALWQALSLLRRRTPRLSAVWDAVFALSLGCAVLTALLRWREEELRLYALLGLLLGGAGWMAGPGALLGMLQSKKERKKARTAGEASSQGEHNPLKTGAHTKAAHPS